MTRTFIQVLVPPAVESPRGAEWAANLAIALVRIVSRRPAGGGHDTKGERGNSLGGRSGEPNAGLATRGSWEGFLRRWERDEPRTPEGLLAPEREGNWVFLGEGRRDAGSSKIEGFSWKG